MSFSKQIGAFGKKALKKSNKVVRGTALSLFSKIVLMTPVGNASQWETKYPPKGYAGGRLRANWQASIGSPRDGEIDSTSSSKALSTITKAAAMLRGDGSIFLSNNLPYAQRVEDGWSKQAPAGMVKVNIAQFKRIVKRQMR